MVKKGGAAKAKKNAAKDAGAEEKGRLEQFIALQQSATQKFSKFAAEVAELSAKGDFTPQTWIQKSSDYWTGLAKDVAKLTRTFLKD